jgi:hypothetical protein
VIHGNVVEVRLATCNVSEPLKKNASSNPWLCTGPLLFKDYFSDVPDSGKIKYHMAVSSSS